MGVKTTSDRLRSCRTTPILGGDLYHAVLVGVGGGRRGGTPGRRDVNDGESCMTDSTCFVIPEILLGEVFEFSNQKTLQIKFPG